MISLNKVHELIKHLNPCLVISIRSVASLCLTLWIIQIGWFLIIILFLIFLIIYSTDLINNVKHLNFWRLLLWLNNFFDFVSNVKFYLLREWFIELLWIFQLRHLQFILVQVLLKLFVLLNILRWHEKTFRNLTLQNILQLLLVRNSIFGILLTHIS